MFLIEMTTLSKDSGKHQLNSEVNEKINKHFGNRAPEHNTASFNEQDEPWFLFARTRIL